MCFLGLSDGPLRVADCVSLGVPFGCRRSTSGANPRAVLELQASPPAAAATHYLVEPPVVIYKVTHARRAAHADHLPELCVGFRLDLFGWLAGFRGLLVEFGLLPLDPPGLSLSSCGKGSLDRSLLHLAGLDVGRVFELPQKPVRSNFLVGGTLARRCAGEGDATHTGDVDMSWHGEGYRSPSGPRFKMVSASRARLTSAPLLDDMGQFVSEQHATGDGSWGILPVAEHDVVAKRESAGRKRLGRLVCRSVAVDAHKTEVASETLFHFRTRHWM
jgi:hypothetical protein